MRWWRSAPSPRKPDWLTARPYAHRGLHAGPIVENSRAAFEAAIANGFGIELDVRAARCGTPYAFHDASLARLCRVERMLADLDRNEMSAVRLEVSGETIPTLEDVANLVAGRAPMLVEIKSDGILDLLFCGQLRDVLQHYAGPVAVMSFDPRLIGWFAQHAPELTRGLVISEEGKGKFRGLVERRLALRLARPDFLAYDIRSLPSPFAAAMRRRGHRILAWTVRTPAEAATAEAHADQIIHEWDAAR